jgi:tetratricopeptide (TPR) repeat protein
MAPDILERLSSIENHLASGQTAEARPMLEAMLREIEVYIDESCVTTDQVQYFSFSSQFEKLAYQRVENDPRQLVVVEAPFDRVYADYAFCLLSLNDPEAAAEALKQAVRWNPMDCAHRLDLAAVLNTLGNDDEFLRLSYSVFERASVSSHLVRAYLNFEQAYEAAEEWETAAACAKCAWRMNDSDPRVLETCERLAGEHQCDPRKQADELTQSLLDAQGIPDGANVAVVVCALLLSDIYLEQGDTDSAEQLTWVAIDLVGQENARALKQLVREQAAGE